MSCPRPDLGERLIELVGARAQAAPDVEEHVAACLSCAAELAALREVHATLDAYKPAPPSESALELARQAGLGRGAALKRPQARLWVAGALGVAASAGFLVAAGVRGDFWQHALGVAALPVLVLACALGLRATARLKPLDPAFLAVMAAGLGLSLAIPPGDGAQPTTCFALILGLTLVPLGVAVSALASGPRIATGAAGAVAGAATCLIGLGALRAHCPASSVGHFAFAHLPSVPIAALIGALGARLSRRFAR
ncbi:MAG TPA: hypothetical protein VFF06_02760 [Polyangia bacterium]|nr:hypothetical protein [Polyangia bacterium]